MEWSITKPDKDGIWLWRFRKSPTLSMRLSQCVGCVSFKDGTIREWTMDNVYPVDVWWNICPVDTCFVGDIN